MENYVAIRKDEIIKFAYICMGLRSIMLNEMSQLERDRHRILSLIYGI